MIKYPHTAVKNSFKEFGLLHSLQSFLTNILLQNENNTEENTV